MLLDAVPLGDAAATIDSLEVGKAADLSLHDWNAIAYPYLDADTPVLDAFVQRARAQGVKAVM